MLFTCVYFLLLIKRYNLNKFLACSTTLIQPSLFCPTFFQLHTFILFISSKTSSSQCTLGLPIGLLDMGFHLFIFCTSTSSAVRSAWPNQFNLCFLINPIIVCPFNISLIYLLSVFILLQFTCCLYLACSSVCNYSHDFLCFSRYIAVCPVCI